MPRARRASNSLASRLDALATQEGLNATRSPSVVVWRMSASEPPTPTLYDASLIIVGSGEKRATFADETLRYDADHALIVTSPLPMLCQTLASANEPVLTMVVSIERAMLRELLVHAPAADFTNEASRAVTSLPLSDELEEAAARLLRYLDSEPRARALASQTIRELLFLVLESPQGSALRAAAESSSRHLAQVLRHMNRNFAKRLSVASLARLARMSLSTFHTRFRETTGLTPLHYVKTLRLMRARQLLREGRSVKSAASEVGYESTAQFSREYRRMFALPPSADSPLRARASTQP